MTSKTSLVLMERIGARIFPIRGHRVILDVDLAKLYGVPTRALNQAVKRHVDRFPADFAFRLTVKEATAARRSRSQTVTLKRGQNIKYLPLAFTEHGAIMAANMLNCPRAVQASVYVVRAFVRLRQMLSTHHALAVKLAELERRIGTHDEAIRELMTAIRELMEPPPERPRHLIGFHPRARKG